MKQLTNLKLHTIRIKFFPHYYSEIILYEKTNIDIGRCKD